ncbi:MAG TPA: thiolase family protein, partial [Acidimicrobiia bacterium]|nr:thiolase family protein [Acidimicrobiia bacterium]
MPNAVIVDAIRTPLGRRNGRLSGWHPVDLAAHVLGTLMVRHDLDPVVVDDVIMGCVSQVGEQALNIGRNALLAAGFPDSVPGTTVDRQCGSSQQAVHFAAQGVIAGAYDLVIAAGVESMSRVPMGSSVLGADPFGSRLVARYPDLVPQGISAELIAEKWALSREELDEYALGSQQRAAQATAEARFDRELVPVPVSVDGVTSVMTEDEGIRPDTTVARLAALKPAFKPDGVVTAGNSSQISDGAAAVVIASEEAAARLGLTPRARVRAFALAGSDPILMLTAPIPVTGRVLERAGLGLDDVDRIEINEAFASVVLAWAREIRPDMDRVNVNGGAIALGHPLGSSGARLMATLLCELERSGGRTGLQLMCEGGGLANATV